MDKKSTALMISVLVGFALIVIVVMIVFVDNNSNNHNEKKVQTDFSNNIVTKCPTTAFVEPAIRKPSTSPAFTLRPSKMPTSTLTPTVTPHPFTYLWIVIMVDVSQSLRWQFDLIKSDTLLLINSNLSEGFFLLSHISLVAFSDVIYYPPELSSYLLDIENKYEMFNQGDIFELSQAIDNFSVKGYETSIYENLGRILDAVHMIAMNLSSPNKFAFIIFTDGRDEKSDFPDLDLSMVIEKAKSLNVSIFSVGYGKFPKEEVLLKMALETNGACLVRSSYSDLIKFYNFMSEGLMGIRDINLTAGSCTVDEFFR
ncbi:MAG: VWA domain-containing protein [Candidatus Hadarchaeum sp.]